MVARGRPIRDKSAFPILTPKAPRRGDERSEESTESGRTKGARRARIGLGRFESIELPTRRFSFLRWKLLDHVFQQVTEASVAWLRRPGERQLLRPSMSVQFTPAAYSANSSHAEPGLAMLMQAVSHMTKQHNTTPMGQRRYPLLN
jgi:hypothetical protein